MPASRLFLVILAGLVLASTTGCGTLFHNLKPHRLWRLNRHSPPMASGSSPYYSVPPPPLSDVVAEQPDFVDSPNYETDGQFAN